MNGTDITELVTIGIVAIIAIAFLAGAFLCWIAGSYFRKIYYVCVTLWEVFGILILFIGSSVDDTGIFGIMLIIAVILLVCILILYEHQRRLADALNILMLIWISIAESGILTAKSQNTMASIVALVCLALTVIAALIVYQADEYSTILPSSFLGAAVCGLLGGWFFPYNLDDDPSKIFFLMLGIEIVLTAVGCLLQMFTLEKKQIIKKKIFSKKWVLIVFIITVTVTITEVAGFYSMSYDSKNIGAKAEKPGKTHKSKKDSKHYYAKGKIKVYSEADTNAKCLGELADGQQVSYVDDSADDWVCIEYKDAQEAYVKKSEVSNVTPDDRYFLDVTPAYGSGYYVPGQKVEIEYNGYLGDYTYFHKWSSNVEGILDDPYATTTKITMSEKDAWIEAVGSDWKPVKIQTENLKELLTDYTIKINGESCTLPVLCYVFEQGDWSVNLDDVDDDDDIDVYTTESLVDFSAWSNGSEMKCQLRDGVDGNKYVVGFLGNKICNEKLQAEFPGGIVLGQSTREDVKKAYGEDSYDVYRGFGGNSLGYWKEFGVGVSFGFDQDGRLTGFALENDPQQYN